MKINFNTLAKVNSDASIEAAIGSLAKRSDTLQLDIHKLLVAIGARWAASGDIRPAVKHVNMLIDTLGKGVRLNAIRSWVEVHFGLTYAEDGEMKGKFVAGKRKATDLDISAMANERWWELKVEPEYKPMDFDKMFNALLAKASKADKSKGDDVDPGLVHALKAAREEYLKANKTDSRMEADPLAAI